MTIVDVKLKLSDETLEYLRRQSTKRQVPLDEVVSEALAQYLDEPSKETLLANLRQAMSEILTENLRSADEVLAELKQEFS